MTFDRPVLHLAEPDETAPPELAAPARMPELGPAPSVAASTDSSIDASIDAPAEPSTTSFVHWCTLDGTGRALVCAACDVSWLLDSGDTCWVCGEHGRRIGDLRAS